tara:strand:- start:611 stop:850 length:240 start_codon:yes stop_codon:yes gene_type:complete
VDEIIDKFPEVIVTREVKGKGGYLNIYVQYTGNSSIAERGELLMNIEEELINQVADNIRLWHEPIGDKNSLRKMRGVMV